MWAECLSVSWQYALYCPVYFQMSFDFEDSQDLSQSQQLGGEKKKRKRSLVTHPIEVWKVWTSVVAIFKCFQDRKLVTVLPVVHLSYIYYLKMQNNLTKDRQILVFTEVLFFYSDSCIFFIYELNFCREY